MIISPYNFLNYLCSLLYGLINLLLMALIWLVIPAITIPTTSTAQTANFHPCNAQPALPICQHGYGKRIAIRRWNAQPGPLDPDAAIKAPLTTQDPDIELKHLKASAILVQDIDNGEILFERDTADPKPIASITKLMTALVTLDADLDLDEDIEITANDHKFASVIPSKLANGTVWSRKDLLKMALTASENSAAQALARTYPGGISAFVSAMNAKAQQLGMNDTNFADPTGLSNKNTASATDLVKLVIAASNQPMISKYSTATKQDIDGYIFNNTNMLIGRPKWDVQLSKTGSTRDAGECLVMLVKLHDRNLAVILLNASGQSGARFGDAVRVRRIVSSQLAAK